MNYIDSNIFVFSVINKEHIGNLSRKLLEKVQNGETTAATSSLTFDELFWRIKKEKGFEVAVNVTRGFLELSNLFLIEVNENTLWKAHELIIKYNLDPRDSIHAACAILRGIHIFISEDDDFDKIREIERKSLNKL